MNKVRDPLTPGRSLFGLRVLDSDPPLAQVLAKAVWVGSMVLSLGSGFIAGIHTGCPLEDYLGRNIIPGTEQVLPR